MSPVSRILETVSLHSLRCLVRSEPWPKLKQRGPLHKRPKVKTILNNSKSSEQITTPKQLQISKKTGRVRKNSRKASFFVEIDVTVPFPGSFRNSNVIVEIEKLFATGGFGNVYTGWDHWARKEVAIKETDARSELTNIYHESRMLRWINAKDTNSE